jgi:F-type H+-transporting ATPase subunit gamma
MPSLKEVRNRIVSVNSTQQITKAMKMVAAAKLRRAQDNINKIKPYAQKLDGILSNLSAALSEGTENPYTSTRDVNRLLMVVVTSDRGLAGAFNTNVIKCMNNYLTENNYNELYNAGQVECLCIGKKGFEALTRRKDQAKINGDYVNFFHDVNFDAAKGAAEWAMDRFKSGYYDKVVVVYNESKNVATQILRADQFLPIVATVSDDAQSSSVDYIYEPSKVEIVQELIPKSLKISFYKYLLESNASEHGARMTAMDKATDNAKELLKDLKLVYNRSRQAAITKEILEIVGGAEALNN